MWISYNMLYSNIHRSKLHSSTEKQTASMSEATHVTVGATALQEMATLRPGRNYNLHDPRQHRSMHIIETLGNCWDSWFLNFNMLGNLGTCLNICLYPFMGLCPEMCSHLHFMWPFETTGFWSTTCLGPPVIQIWRCACTTTAKNSYPLLVKRGNGNPRKWRS